MLPRWFLILAALLSFSAVSVYAQELAPAPSASPLVEVTPAPLPSPSMVAVAEPVAPPQWIQDLIVKSESFPVIGGFISKAIVFVGSVTTFLTMGIALLLGLLTTLQGVFNFAGLASLSAKIQSFKNGSLMYWLKYFSHFNAQKPEPL